MSVQSIVETSFAIESIFLAANTFVVGFYFTKWDEGFGKEKLKPLLNMTYILTGVAVLLVSFDIGLLLWFENDAMLKISYSFFSIVILLLNVSFFALIYTRRSKE